MDDAETVTGADAPSAGTWKHLQGRTHSAKSDDLPQHQLVERWLRLNNLCRRLRGLAGKNKSFSGDLLTLTNKVSLISSMDRRVFWFAFQMFIRSRVFRGSM